jgi:hypothetical protein
MVPPNQAASLVRVQCSKPFLVVKDNDYISRHEEHGN